MKNNLIVLIVIFLFSQKSFGQIEKFNFNNGEIKALIQPIGEMKSEEFYNKLNEWINYNFKKADAVIGSSVENKMLRFTGIKPNFAKSFGYVYDLEFTIKIEFKENKYRMTVEDLRSGYRGIFTNLNLKDYYKSDGEPKKAYKSFVYGIENTLNNLNISIYNYLTEKSKIDDEW